MLKQIDLLGKEVDEKKLKEQKLRVANFLDNIPLHTKLDSFKLEELTESHLDFWFWDSQYWKWHKLRKDRKQQDIIGNIAEVRLYLLLEMESIEKCIEINCEWYLSLMRKAALLIDFGKYKEAMLILVSLYGCENQEAVWPSALVNIARVAAVEEIYEDVLKYLSEAIAMDIFFDYGEGRKVSRPPYILRDIDEAKEFDKYRDLLEFKNLYKIDEAKLNESLNGKHWEEIRKKYS